MKQAHTWVVTISAYRQNALKLGDILQAAGYSYTWFSHPREFFVTAPRVHPRCLVVDIDTKVFPHGLATFEELSGLPWRWPTVVVNTNGELPEVMKMMRLSHCEFIQGPLTNQALLDAVYRTGRFRPYENTHGTGILAGGLIGGLVKLSCREVEVAGEMLHGRSSKQISANLGISEKTVELHRTQVLRKMQVHSTGELVRLYLNHGAY